MDRAITLDRTICLKSKSRFAPGTPVTIKHGDVPGMIIATAGPKIWKVQYELFGRRYVDTKTSQQL